MFFKDLVFEDAIPSDDDVVALIIWRILETLWLRFARENIARREATK